MVDYTELADMMNGAPAPEIPENQVVVPQVTPAQTPATAAPATEAPAPPKAATAPQARRQTAPDPASQAAVVAPAEPARPQSQAAGAMPPGGMQGGMQNFLQMIFMAIAQMLGINMTAMQQAQANQNKPAAVVAAAPAGQGLKPSTSGPGLNPNAPSGPGLKVQGATTQGPAVQTPTAEELKGLGAKPEGDKKPETPAAASADSSDPLGDFIAERGFDKPDAPAAPVAKNDGSAKPEPTTLAQRFGQPQIQPASLAVEYNRASIQALPSLQDRLQTRADRITEYTEAGMSLRDASRQVSTERRQELAAQGLDRNTVNSLANGEEQVERQRIAQIEQQQRAFERDQRQQQQQELAAARREASMNMRNRRAADMENERDGRALGGVMADVGGLRGNEKRMAQALGAVGGKVFGAITGDDRPSGAGDRENGRFARDIGNAAGGGTYGRAAEILVRRGGEVITYPQQDRSNMPQPAAQAGKWDSNQISAAQRFSAAYGSSPEERQQLLAGQGPQAAMVDNAPAMSGAETVRRMQTTSGLYGPGS
ncbi:MAG: hypothetical protein HYS17_02130 [Micavibrio aeruginosavorus]|uniref:Uncharacterized protein n=1 Tax=Micavibrio aeruginosavorus TaxID=349221 RepID=A0A7T5UGT7_9BACT|nr:MAG: hypothetical protein HYS17_02130 [Micavibrio aeruginosavorus]